MLTRDELLNQEIILARKAYFAVSNSQNVGANVILEVFLSGRLNPATELCVNLTDVDVPLKAFVAQVDHKNIDLDLRPMFDPDKSLKHLESFEFLASVAWNYLEKPLKSQYAALCGLKLHVGEGEVLSLGFKQF